MPQGRRSSVPTLLPRANGGGESHHHSRLLLLAEKPVVHRREEDEGMHSIARLQRHRRKNKDDFFSSVPSSRHPNSNETLPLPLHPSFFFCISLYPWKASLLESTWHACSLRFLGRPLVRRFLQLLLCPASGLSTMHAQSYLITKRPRKRTLGLPRENVRNFRTYLLSIVFVPFSFYFVVGFLAFDLRHAFRSYLDPRKRYASCGEKILGRRRICGIVDNVALFRETRLVFASTNSRCVRAYSRVDSQRDGIWPDFASTRKGL